jgi:predicted membrane-bound dolichyl-phosphate-mannose-protein mannosyltransferase
MSKKIVTIFIVSVIAIMMGIIISDSKRTEKLTDEIDGIFSSQTPTYYYGDTCPNCHKIDDFIKENGIKESFPVTRKEVYKNQTNAQELTKIAVERCGIETKEIGVPFMVAENKCMVGYLEIVEYIKEKTGLETSEENNEEAEKEKATNSDSETPVEQ